MMRATLTEASPGKWTSRQGAPGRTPATGHDAPRLWAWLLPLLAATACGGDPAIRVPAGDCDTDQVLVAGRCQVPCTPAVPDGACAPGALCVAGQCRPEELVEDCGPLHPLGRCEPGLVCVAGNCVDPTTTEPCGPQHPDGYCDYGELCIGGACWPVQPPELCGPVNPQGLCPGEQRCEAGTCVDIPLWQACSPYNPQGECGPWQECVDGQCAPPVPPDSCSPQRPDGRCPADSVCVAGNCQPITPETACSPANPQGLCPWGEACLAGVCVPLEPPPACDSAHPTGWCPDELACQAGQCLPIEPEQACSPSNPAGLCPSGQRCIDGVCQDQPVWPACSPEHPAGLCPGAAVCVGGACVTPPCDVQHPAGACPDGSYCQAGACRPFACDALHPDGVCPAGEVCYQGACEPLAGPACSPQQPDGACVDPQQGCDGRTDAPTFGHCVWLCSSARPQGLCPPGLQCLLGTCRDPCPSRVWCGSEQTCCPVGDECLAGRCLSPCPAPRERCGQSLACCPSGQVCVNGLWCQAPCAGERCGPIGELCCGADQVCTMQLSCVRRCADARPPCGAALDLCCAPEESCVAGQCLPPGTSCVDFLDCEYGQYCEPTLGQCLPVEPGGGGASGCQYPSPARLFEPAVEWRFTGLCLPSAANCQQFVENVLSFPAVADLDRDGVPEVVVRAYAGEDLERASLLVLDGASGGVEAVYSRLLDPAIPWLHGAGHQLLVDLDGSTDPAAPGDEALEIVAVAATGLVAFNDPSDRDPADGDGTVLWTATMYPLNRALNGGAPGAADFDGDGQVEIYMGAAILAGRTGALLARPPDARATQGGGSRFDGGWISVAADLDGDGRPELVTGNRAWKVTRSGTTWSMTPLWQAVSAVAAPPDYTTTVDIPHGFAAVANLIVAPAGQLDSPEVINVAGGNLYVLDGRSGTLLAGPIPVPAGAAGTNHGGPPTVADFDGDGRPEIAAAGSGCLAVYDLDCLAGYDPGARADHQALPGCAAPAVDRCGSYPSMVGVLWNQRAQDFSSAVTGSSVFDFDGDGVDEVLYNDECFFRVFDGRSGSVLLERPSSSRTNSEYPIVVDVDADRQSEIVLVANHDQVVRDHCLSNWDADPAYAPYPQYDQLRGPGQWCDLASFPEHERECLQGAAGVTVFGDTTGRWVKTRPVWHQHAYHVTDVVLDSVTGAARVPADEEPSWSAHNTYRKNVRGYAPLNAPDIQVASLAADLRACPTVTLTARVVNAGGLGVPAGLPVSFYGLWQTPAVLLGTLATSQPLLPGGGLYLSLEWTPPPALAEQALDFRAVADDDGLSDVVAECAEDNNAADLRGVSCHVPAPIALCRMLSPAANPEPIHRVGLSGAASYDPRAPGDASALTNYAWEVLSWPDGAWVGDFAPDGNGTASYSFWLPIAGSYQVRLTVFNRQGVASLPTPDSICTIEAVPRSLLHVQLVWDDLHNDQDLHLLWYDNPAGVRDVCDYFYDCYYANPRPTWHPGDYGANPRLDIDDVDGKGPENINIDQPRPGVYRVHVHYWTDGWGSTSATEDTVRVYLKGVKVGEWRRVLRRDGALWAVADVVWQDEQVNWVQPLPGDSPGATGWECYNPYCGDRAPCLP